MKKPRLCGSRRGLCVGGSLVAFVSVGLAALALAGCGSGSRHPETRRRLPPVARAQATHEYASLPAPSQTPASPASSPVIAVAAFAGAYINWTADTVSAVMHRLASRSVGQARSAMQLAATETAADYELQRGGVANSGSVEAVAPLPRQTNQYVVVTRELTTATATNAYQGLAPAWHVAIATVTELAPGEWAVSGWQPES